MNGNTENDTELPIYYEVYWNSGITAYLRVGDSIELATRAYGGGWNIRETDSGYLEDAERVASNLAQIDEEDSPWADRSADTAANQNPE